MYKFSINGDVGENVGAQFYTYEADGKGNTIIEFLDNVTISHIDQDGGEQACYGFFEAPDRVQKVILKSVGISELEAEEALEALVGA